MFWNLHRSHFDEASVFISKLPHALLILKRATKNYMAKLAPAVSLVSVAQLNWVPERAK